MQRPTADEVLATFEDGVLTLDPDSWCCSYVNAAAARLLGWSCGTNRCLRSEHPTAVITTMADTAERVARERRSASFLVRDDATGKWIEGTVFPMAMGATVHLRDVTARREAEQANEASHRRLQQMFDHLGAAIGIYAPDGTVLEVNRAPVERAGLTREDFVGKKLWDTPSFAYSPEAQARVYDAVARAARGESVRFDLPVQSGSLSRHIDLSAIPVRDDEGRVTEIIGFGIDVSDRTQAIAQLGERERWLSTMLAEKDALLREVQHRVRNNLQVVCSLLGLHASRTDDTAIRAALEECRSQVRSISLVHDRLSSPGNLVILDLADHLQSLVRSFAGRVPGGLRVACASDPLEIGLDVAVPLGLLLNELLSNAIESATSSGRDGTLAVSCQRHEQTFVVVVKHDGEGEPPQQGVRGTKLVRALVEQVAGELEVVDAAHLRVTIPLH